MGRIKNNAHKILPKAKLQAFTLVETIVAVVILLSVSGILMYLLLQFSAEGFSMRTHQMEGRLRILMEHAKSDTLLRAQQIEETEYLLGQSVQNGQNATITTNNVTGTTTTNNGNLQLWCFYIQDRADSSRRITHYLWLNPTIHNQP